MEQTKSLSISIFFQNVRENKNSANYFLLKTKPYNKSIFLDLSMRHGVRLITLSSIVIQLKAAFI